MTNTKMIKILDTKEKVLEELDITSVQELSNENIFNKFIQLDAKIDKEVLGMILPNIKDFSNLVIKQQEFIAGMAENHKFIDEKTFDSFNKTKDIISEILKANPSMDSNLMIYLVDSLKEMDKMISGHAKDAKKSFNEIIKAGIAVGGVVAAAIFAIIFKGRGGSGKI